MEFVDKLVSELEAQEHLSKQIRENIKLTNSHTQGLMDDHINNLKVNKETQLLQEAQLEKMGIDDEGGHVDLLQKIAYQKSFVGTFQALVDEEMLEFERVCKDSKLMGARLFSEEQKVVSKRNCDVAKILLSKFQKGVDCESVIMPQPLVLVKTNDVSFEKCVNIAILWAWVCTYVGRQNSFL